MWTSIKDFIEGKSDEKDNTAQDKAATKKRAAKSTPTKGEPSTASPPQKKRKGHNAPSTESRRHTSRRK